MPRATAVIEVRDVVRLPWARRAAEVVAVRRRGPILRPAHQAEGVYGLDLTSGCAHGCPFCYIRGLARFPGEGRVLFDPNTTSRLAEALDALPEPPRSVVLSPTSDPLPPLREVRDATVRVARLLLERDLPIVLLTRGRFPRQLIEILAEHHERVRIAVGFVTADHRRARHWEPAAASPALRLRSLARLVEAGVEVEARLEPLVPDVTDTADNLRPLLLALSRAGVRRIVAHYLFLNDAIRPGLDELLGPLGLSERLDDQFAGGPVFRIGSVGPTKHLPAEARRVGLARVTALAAEFGLVVETGAGQNPDLRRS
jgi:DNA repair photolyase